jgi:hypothetical protein
MIDHIPIDEPKLTTVEIIVKIADPTASAIAVNLSDSAQSASLQRLKSLLTYYYYFSFC